MTNMRNAMTHYFERLTASWAKWNSLPKVPWEEGDDPALIVSESDDEGYADWRPQPASVPQGLPALHPELVDYFSSYRFRAMDGSKDQYDFSFYPQPTDAEAVRLANWGIQSGESYRGQGYVYLAAVSHLGNDDLVLLFNQFDGSLYVLDTDKGSALKLNMTLTDLIDTMEAF